MAVARLVKIVSYYPVMLISSLLLLVAKLFGWGCVIAFLLSAGFKLAGVLVINWVIVGSLLGVGVITLLLADAYVELLVKLDIHGGAVLRR